MRWQDLKKDIALMHHLGVDDPARLSVVVARRVADLFDQCPACGGEGKVEWVCAETRMSTPCTRCGGTGVIPAEAFEIEFLSYWKDLARYLFGE